MKDYSIKIYIANESDTVDSICERFHITKQLLYIFNPLLKNKVKISNIPIKIPYSPSEETETERKAVDNCPKTKTQPEETKVEIAPEKLKEKDLRCSLLPFVVLVGQCKEAILIKAFLPSIYESYEKSNLLWLRRSLSRLCNDEKIIAETENYYRTLMNFDDILSQEDENAISEHLKKLSAHAERIRSFCPETYRDFFSDFNDFCIQYFIHIKMENYSAANDIYMKIAEKLDLKISVIG